MKLFHKNMRSLVLASLIFTLMVPPSFSQEGAGFSLPPAVGLVSPSQRFEPALLQGIKVDPDTPLNLDFIVSPGNSGLEGALLQDEAQRLIKYFLSSLTLPEADLWVNLSPNEKNRIIPSLFGGTEMGRDLLGQDYVLKQLSASLMYPENNLGKEFWQRVSQKAHHLYGVKDVPLNSLSRVWIVPQRAVIRENGSAAYISESHLKVMLEEEHEGLTKETTESSKVFRQIILPELEREVNQGKNFASLRQIYHSLILAAWYKKKIRDSILHRVYVDQRKVSGLENGDATIKDRIYQRYLEAFQKGAYSIIKEEENPDTHELVPRKYFSGGVDMTNLDTSSALIIEAQSSASSSIDDAPDSVVVQTRLKPTDRQQILEIIADDFEKPTVKYAVKPEREMNEKVVERNAAVEIQLELESLMSDLGMIITLNRKADVGSAQDRRDAENNSLRKLRFVYQNMPVSVHEDKTFSEYSEILKSLKAYRQMIDNDIEKEDKAENKEALKTLNQKAIRNNRLVLKAQLLISGKIFAGQSSLSSRAAALNAVQTTLNGALNSAQRLEEELDYRIRRLQAAQKIKEMETTDWLGRIVRTYRMSGFDIEVMPAKVKGQDPVVTVRQQHWVNVNARLAQILTHIRTGRITDATDGLDELIDLYSVQYLVVYEKYRDIGETLRSIKAMVQTLPPEEKPSKDKTEKITAKINALRKSIGYPKQRVWVDIQFENIDAAFRGFVHRFAGYIEDVGTISRNKGMLEFYATRLKVAQKKNFLSRRNAEMMLAGLAPIVEWAERGFVYEKQKVSIRLKPTTEKIKATDYGGARQDLEVAANQLNNRLEEIERIVGNSKRQAASVFSTFRDKDIKVRANVIAQDVINKRFPAAFSKLTELRSIYFDQDQVEPGYIRAARSVEKMMGSLRGADRVKDKERLVTQVSAYLTLIQSDIDHKYSFKVDVTQFGQATFVYINPGTTASGLLTMQKLSADNTRVSIGRGWIPRSKLQYTRLGEGQSVTFETISSSSSGVTGNEGPPGIENVNNVGGIDFTDYEKSLIIEDESPNLPVMIFPPLQEQLKNVPGFVPVIINIEPLYSVPAFLGMEQAPAAPAVLKLTS